ncbi:MAG: L-lactate dehydrogenase [Acidimicrobiales bacterium]|nr:L-lactate dehydrogenase [Acidimicrobiales bacterium]
MARDRSLDIAPASVRDYRELARKRLPRQLFDYIDGGAYEESTMRANESDLGELQLRQRVMRDVSNLDLRTTVVGQDLSMPVILAPVGLAGMFAPRAEVLAARAAQNAGVAFCESTVSIAGIEEVQRSTNAPFWFQLYVMRDRSYAETLMARASAAHCPVLVLTVDLAVVGARYRDTRNAMIGEVSALAKARRGVDLVTHPQWIRDVAIGGKPHTFGNLEDAVPEGRSPADFREWVDAQFDPSVTWEDLAWVREHWKGKLVIKGVLDAEDARIAADAGVDAIVVSNHGGRQLDDTPSTVQALGPIVQAVGEQLEVLVDGGIRSGLDVTKMIALGAKACLVGRAWAWAVAGGGQQGVEHVLETIRDEMKVAMALTGAPTIAALNPDILVSTPR